MAPSRSPRSSSTATVALSLWDSPPANSFLHAQIASKPSPTAVRHDDKGPSPLGTPPIDSTHPKTDGPNPIRSTVVLSTTPNLSHATQKLNGSTIPASHSRNGTLSSAPESSEPDSASWSREDESTLSSGDDRIPPTRRFPSRGLPPSYSRARTDGRPPSVPWLPTSGYSSRHSQHYLRDQTVRSGGPGSEPGYPDNEPNSVSSAAERQQLWDKLDGQRRKVNRLRADLAGKRKGVRHLRRQKDEADNAFMQIIRPHLTSSKGTAVVTTDLMGKRFIQLQSIRDEYYSAESALEPLELELDREELELQALEARFFQLLYDGIRVSHKDSFSARSEDSEDDEEVGDDESSGDDEAASRISLLGISGDREEDIHPLYRELLDAVADREDAKEHHTELRIHRHEILHNLERKLHLERVRNNQGKSLSEEELRLIKSALALVQTDADDFKARWGVSVQEGDLEFLQTFEHKEADVRERLEEASRNVARLRDLCLEKNVMRKHASYSEEYTIYSGTNRATLQPDGNMTIDSYADTGVDLAHPKFPILLSNPSHVLDLQSPMEALENAMRLPKDSPSTVNRRAECMKELGISKLMKKVESKPDYINQWLIHRLRTSPMEAELLFAVAEEKFKIVNLRRWQEEVLYYWRKDEAANLSPNDFHGPMTPRDELDMDDGSEFLCNSVIGASTRAKSEDVNLYRCHRRKDTPTRSVRSLS
ncbi:hypothetical protein B0H66DRAFT_599503 [Apodospora peruviana]|uniref:Uncharacterized protein n=1 Tax=Apodospora peruviana TaxID=516989 RepID=A0AAE0MBV5_9PEZI|nr:hypothetical protein B0H66DRAFT_599503 [Apodospora peruviana]